MDSQLKTIYTLNSLLHSRVAMLSEMIFERLSDTTGEPIDSLRDEWRDRSRQFFLDTCQKVMVHPETTNLIPAVTMMEVAEEMWKQEDEMLLQSGPSPGDDETNGA